MPPEVVKSLWEIIPTLIYFVIGLICFGISVKLMNWVTPFSIRKEIEEDQNVALGIVMGAALIGIAIILGAVIGS
jgi:putative membrane protein